MLLRPSPGRLRAIAHAGKARSRPRPANVLTPCRHFSSFGSAAAKSNPAVAARSHGITTLFRRVLTSATRNLRTGVARQPLRFHPHALISALRSVKHASLTVRSPLLRGAVDAFRSSVQRTSAQTTSRAYSQLSASRVRFARGTLSGLGPRPAAGQLTLSPLRGGVGLQTSRKFSSGRAVFDNLIVNAPLALRLAGNELEDKARLAKRQPTRTSRAAGATGARRTGSTFSTAKLARDALLFATTKTNRHLEQQKQQPESVASSSNIEPAELGLYFQFPQLPIPSEGTVVSMRLIDPLYDALGGREPLPPTASPRLFDSAFLYDAQQALQYEHRRYLQAKALLRVLWDSGCVAHDGLQLGDPAVWTVSVRGRPDEVRALLEREIGFAIDEWCSFDGSGSAGGLDLSFVASEGETSFERLSTPPLSSLEDVSEAQSSSVSSDAVMSLPSSVEVDEAAGSSLYDSRSF